MCYAVQCQVCGKTTWAGCGEHVDEVKAVVPQDQWCDGHPELDAGAGDRSPAGRR